MLHGVIDDFVVVVVVIVIIIIIIITSWIRKISCSGL
jgi:hypothetical protein